MKLNDAVMINKFNIPGILKEKLTIAANYPLMDIEVRIFGYALLAIDNEIRQDNLDKNDLTHVNVIFTKDGSFSIQETIKTVYGHHFSLSVYALENLRKTNNERFMLFAFVEELVHHYWRIENETDVKYKVLKIVQFVDAGITLEKVKSWGVNGL